MKVQIGQLAENQKSFFPNQPLLNPKVENSGPSQCHAIHTLRSGKQVDNKVSSPQSHPVPKPTFPVPMQPTFDKPSSSSEPSTSQAKGKEKVDEQPYKPRVPYPNRLLNNKSNAHMEKIKET